VLRLPVPLVLFSCIVIIVDSLPSAKSVSFLVLEVFSVLTVTVPLTISPGLYSAFSNLISKDKSVPFSNLLNIIDCHLFKGCRTDDLKFMLILFVNFFESTCVYRAGVMVARFTNKVIGNIFFQ
jgi:hypothetical protein